jgi:hypothetical protein
MRIKVLQVVGTMDDIKAELKRLIELGGKQNDK